MILSSPWTRDWGVKPRLFFNGGGRTPFIGSYERRSCKDPMSCIRSIIAVVFVRLLAPLRPSLAFFSKLFLNQSLDPHLSPGDNPLQTNLDRFGEVLLHLPQFLQSPLVWGHPPCRQADSLITAFHVLQRHVSFPTLNC